ncbi:MAG: LysE family translocator [Oligoflexales bacterium]
MPPILPILAYTFAMSLSPGPVNILCASYGNKEGFLRTQRFVLGACLGFVSLTFAMGLGLNKVATSFPFIIETLKIIGAMYLIYLGYNIARSSRDLNVENANRSGFIKGLLLQWGNPKAWIGSMVGIASFASESFASLALFASIYLGVTWVCLSTWSFIGDRISKFLSSARQELAFNIHLVLH